MESLSTQKPIVDNEETLKAFTKHIYYKRTETIDELVEEVRGGALNFIGLINPEKKNTFIHVSTMLNSIELLTYFLEKFDKLYADLPRDLAEQKKREWVNSQDHTLITPLQYASYNGNFKAIELLRRCGADHSLRAAKGQTIHHISVENDKVLPLIYFRDLVDPNVKNDLGETPLIYACEINQEAAAYFLMSNGANLDDQDNNGSTALHRAAYNGNTRLVKKLVAKGARIDIRDAEGCRPLEIAMQRQYDNLFQYLEKPPVLSVLFNVTSPDNKLNHTRCRLYTTFFFLFVLLPLFDLCLFAYTKPQELCHKIIIVSFPFLAVFFVLSWLVSPGYMKENKELEEAVECLAKYPSEPHKVCPDCLIVKPKRSKHCDACGKCVMVFDHHCPFLHNCVGARNVKFFVLLLLSLNFVLISTCILSFKVFINKEIEPESSFNYFHLERMSDGQKIFFYVAVMILGIVSLLTSFGVFQLTIVHILNLILGKTTSERYGFKAKPAGNSSEEEEPQVMVGSTISSDFGPSYQQLKSKPCHINIFDMLCFNGYNAEYYSGK